MVLKSSCIPVGVLQKLAPNYQGSRFLPLVPADIDGVEKAAVFRETCGESRRLTVRGHSEQMGRGRRRRLFAHVVGNIDGLLSWEASREVEFEPKPVFLKRLSVVAKTSLEADFGSPETVRLWQKHDARESL